MALTARRGVLIVHLAKIASLYAAAFHVTTPTDAQKVIFWQDQTYIDDKLKLILKKTLLLT